MAATLGGALRRARRRTSGDTGDTAPTPVGTRLQRVDAADGRDVDITSPANPRVKWLQSLRRRRVRDEERVTVVEGYAELGQRARRRGEGDEEPAAAPQMPHAEPASPEE